MQPRYAFGHGLSYTNFTIHEPTIKQVTELSEVPPARPAKGPMLDFTGPIPDASEAVAPKGFWQIPRYLYSWLSTVDAELAVKAGENGSYDYPEGYSGDQKPGPRSGGGEGGNPALWDVAYTLSVTVENSGPTHNGKAVMQAYVQFPEGIAYDTPIVQLRDFEKTKELAPGEKQTLELKLTRKDLSVWDVVRQDWVVPGVEGRFKLWVGEASDALGVVCYTDGMECEEDAESPV